MTYPAWPPNKEREEIILEPNQALPRSRPQEIGDEDLRVEDIIAWLEGMDPLKKVRIVMKTRNSTVISDIHTITQGNGPDGTVDIFPTKMPKSADALDIREMLAKNSSYTSQTKEPMPKSDSDAAAQILNEIRRRKKEKEKQQYGLIATGPARERLTGAE